MKKERNQKPRGQGWVLELALTKPSLKNNTADVDRLCQAVRLELNAQWVDVDLGLAGKIPEILRANNYKIRCVVFQDQGRAVVFDVQSLHGEGFHTGLAVDLGTTRIALRLVHLKTGQVLGENAFDNPQTVIGPDILTRIHHADETGGVAELQQLITDSLNRHIKALCESCGISFQEIYIICVAGNTTMSHLLTGLPVKGIIREPYIPAANRFSILRASDLGINAHRQARVMVFPNVGSYLGGDVIAGILYSSLYQNTDTTLLIDMGTNAEVVLGNNQWMIACAGAAGPALEGGVSPIGTTAKPGVIDEVYIDSVSRQLTYHTIDELPPTGICGTGFIDLVAGLFISGMIDIRGKFIWSHCEGHVIEKNDQRRFVIVPADESDNGRDLSISQVDVDSLIRSKAAMYTILETITGTMGIELSHVKKFYVAGTFGTIINPRSAINIGMLPDLPPAVFQPIGNSSLGGATRILTSRAALQEIDNIRSGLTYLELNVNQDFMNRFSAAKFLPHTDPRHFPSVPRPK